MLYFNVLLPLQYILSYYSVMCMSSIWIHRFPIKSPSYLDTTLISLAYSLALHMYTCSYSHQLQCAFEPIISFITYHLLQPYFCLYSITPIHPALDGAKYTMFPTTAAHANKARPTTVSFILNT